MRVGLSSIDIFMTRGFGCGFTPAGDVKGCLLRLYNTYATYVRGCTFLLSYAVWAQARFVGYVFAYLTLGTAPLAEEGGSVGISGYCHSLTRT